jgi:hypothetical protein
MAERKDGATGQPPKAVEGVDPGADLWGRRQNSKLFCFTLLWEELAKQLQLKGNPASAW